MKKEIYSIPGKMIGQYDPGFNIMIDTWSNLLVSQIEFKSTIHDIGIPYAQKNGIKHWVVDTSKAEAVFKKEVRDFIEGTVAPRFAQIGIKYFIMVLPASALAALSAKNVARINNDQQGMQTITVGSISEAYDFLNKVAIS